MYLKYSKEDIGKSRNDCTRKEEEEELNTYISKNMVNTGTLEGN